MQARYARLLVALCAAVAGCGPVRMPVPATTTALAGCPVTTLPEPAFIPPEPYPAQLSTDYGKEFWYGTPQLWTILHGSGVWTDLPAAQGGYSQKVFFWSDRYDAQDELEPSLSVRGRRLDADAVPLIASGATNASWGMGTAMLVGVVIPTEGCWEITGTYKGKALSFVVLVEP